MTDTVETKQFIEPIDAIHRASLSAINQIRRDIFTAKMAAARWEPAPMPAAYGKTRRTR